jgi:hypothetical protein
MQSLPESLNHNNAVSIYSVRNLLIVYSFKLIDILLR